MSDMINRQLTSHFSDFDNTIKPGSVLDVSLKSQSVSTGASFQNMLEDQLRKNAANQPVDLQFSKHAQQRVEQRGIEITDSFMNDLSMAVSKAREKGSKDMVVIDRNGAFIVNVPNNIIVTAMSGEELKENIFTNIDSAVVI